MEKSVLVLPQRIGMRKSIMNNPELDLSDNLKGVQKFWNSHPSGSPLILRGLGAVVFLLMMDSIIGISYSGI